jgi:hypothetical protein
MSYVGFKILLHLPYSRKLEEEADEVGMLFAAKVSLFIVFHCLCNNIYPAHALV